MPVNDAQPAESPGASPNAEVERLKNELSAARGRIDELARAYQANERDREAFKQRLLREREQLLEVGKGKAALAVIEAIDELDLCLTTGEQSALAQGVRLIRDNLVRKLEGLQVSRFELVGTVFDPALAEASDLEFTPMPEDDGRVLAVIKACYQANGRVVRPGLVKVARYVKHAHA
jgi:molecular chaperone GrpE